jgi:hypothetical protein
VGKYGTLGSAFDRIFRNTLNKALDDVDTDIQAQKKRVDDLIVGTSQPSEVVDSRGGFPVLGARLDDVTSQLAQNRKRTAGIFSIRQYGGKGDGITDDTQALRDTLTAYFNAGCKGKVSFDGVIPSTDPGGVFLITEPTEIDYFVEIEGVSGTLKNIYNGKQDGTRIKYTGTGTFLKINGITADPNKIHPSGSRISNISIEGTSTAECAIKVNERDCASTEMRNVTFENVFIYSFTSGWAFELHEVYSPILINCNVQNCGGVGLLVNAHATTFIGGSLEQCAFGLYNKESRPVSFTGTTIEGISANRPNCTIPSGFTVWSSWAASDNPRATLADYEGIGVVSFGGQLILDKIYFEANDWNVVGENLSHITLINSYHETTPTSKGSVNFAGLYLEVKGNRFIGDPVKNHVYLEPSIPANYCYIKENNRHTVSDGKYINTFTGFAGVIESEELWGRTIHHYNTVLGTDGIKLTASAVNLKNNQIFVDPGDSKLKFKDSTGAIKVITLT